MNSRYKDIVCVYLVLLLLWNPIVLWLYFKSIVIAAFVPILISILTIFIASSHSMRLKAWAFNLCAIVGILFCAEVVFDQVYADKSIPNLYELRGNYYFNRPRLDTKFHDPEFVSSYKTNVQGYRIDELTSADTKIDKCDWLFIGDSYTQGAQVDYCDMFSTLLYRDFPDKVIVNAGISGAGLYDELNFFKDKGRELHPEVVFLQIGAFNDFTNIVEHRAGFQDYLTERSSLYRFYKYQLTNSDELPLGRWTEPFFPNREDNIDNNIFFRESSPRKEKDKQAMLDCISEFKREVEEAGGQLVVVFLPSKEQVSPELLQEVLNAYNIKQEEIDLSIPATLCGGICKTLGVKFINLYDAFSTSNTFPFFAHDEHMNTTGHRITAEEIAKAMHDESHRYEYMSTGNRHDRYPTVLPNESVLLQTQSEDYNMIVRRSLVNGTDEILFRAPCELVHPVMSKDGSRLAYTEGDQEHSETSVNLHDFATGHTERITPRGRWGAIPAFSPDGNSIAYPSWTTDDLTPKITIRNIATGAERVFMDGAECWRPVFSADGSELFYLQKQRAEDHFVVKRYNLATGRKELLLRQPYDIWDIALSPSMKYMVYSGKKDGNWDLFLYEFATKATIQLTKTLGDEWDPAFGADDEELWFAGVFGFNDGIYRINLSSILHPEDQYSK